MTILNINVFRVMAQGTQHIGKSVHTSSTVNGKELKTLPPNDRIKCTLIPGDGVGPELLNCVQEVFKAAEVPVDFETVLFSEINPKQSAPFKDVVDSIIKNKICIKGATLSRTSGTGALETLNMKMRKTLDIYANVLHAKCLPNVKSRYQNVDCIIIREQTEGEYSALEHEAVPGVAECLKIITAVKSERIAKFAFDYAVKLGRKKITAVHKANIMKFADGLFLKSCERISKLYPRIGFEKMIVDNCTMQLVSDPLQFDVMVTPNLYGNILNNIAIGLVGGAGIVAGANYSAQCAIFEQGSRHAFVEATGKNIANPTAVLRAAVYLLAHVNLHCHSQLIRSAYNKVLSEGKVRTVDIGGQATTNDFTKAVINCLGE